jgi:DNA-binding MarR family transcriptional regulator
MRSLADEWECDASNATWIVDRLEKFGLAERRTVPHDRRVKLVVLTARGVKTKAELMEEFLIPPPELLDMDRRDLDTLQRAMEKFPRLTPVSVSADRKKGRLPLVGAPRVHPHKPVGR